MQYTEEQIIRANQTDLVSFLNAQGEQLVKSGREYRWKKHDSVTVSGNRWYRHSQSKGGYPVDFVMEFYYATFPEAVKMLIGEEGEGSSTIILIKIPPTLFLFSSVPWCTFPPEALFLQNTHLKSALPPAAFQ